MSVTLDAPGGIFLPANYPELITRSFRLGQSTWPAFRQPPSAPLLTASPEISQGPRLAKVLPSLCQSMSAHGWALVWSWTYWILNPEKKLSKDRD
ncbi:MAG: hypothetical protein HQ456_07695 [Polynucleobacter sp.]|nr:hypothetical protein [Polynucleobacter sp.]